MSKQSSPEAPKANSLDEVLALLERKKGTDNYFPEMHWVAKNYSQADLIRDLHEINNRNIPFDLQGVFEEALK